MKDYVVTLTKEITFSVVVPSVGDAFDAAAVARLSVPADLMAGPTPNVSEAPWVVRDAKEIGA